jgi:plastocyanin
VTARGRAAGLALVLATAACGGAGPAPRTRAVAIRAFRYVPARVEAAVGDTLVWSNRDVVPHTATADGGGWDTGSIPAGGEGRVVVRRSGRQGYVCAFHPNMKGVLVVRE